MKQLSLFRAASALLVFLCLGHTAGGMLAQNSLGADSDAVFESMKRVHFVFNGADSTWYGFWFGFGLTTSAFLLLSAVVSWQLDCVPGELWPRVAPIAWALIASQAFNTYLAFRYFFAAPTVLGVLITTALVLGTLRKHQSARRAKVTLRTK